MSLVLGRSWKIPFKEEVPWMEHGSPAVIRRLSRCNRNTKERKYIVVEKWTVVAMNFSKYFKTSSLNMNSLNSLGSFKCLFLAETWWYCLTSLNILSSWRTLFDQFWKTKKWLLFIVKNRTYFAHLKNFVQNWSKGTIVNCEPTLWND